MFQEKEIDFNFFKQSKKQNNFRKTPEYLILVISGIVIISTMFLYFSTNIQRNILQQQEYQQQEYQQQEYQQQEYQQQEYQQMDYNLVNQLKGQTSNIANQKEGENSNQFEKNIKNREKQESSINKAMQTNYVNKDTNNNALLNSINTSTYENLTDEQKNQIKGIVEQTNEFIQTIKK